MVTLVETSTCEQREDKVWRHPEPLEILSHRTQIYGPPGDQTLRRLKTSDTDHWYLFNRSGLAVARVTPQEWSRAVGGV